MNLIGIIRSSLILLFTLASTLVSNGQYIEGNSLISVPSNPYNNDYKGLVSSRITHLNGKVYISWTVMNDTVQGCFAVYKSKDYGRAKAINYVTFPEGLVRDVPILFSIVDSSVENQYDIYHIVKIDQNTVFYANEHVLFRNSVANMRLPEHDSYIEQKRLAESRKEFYSQGF
jgi:hypothetical protein